jgi:hypothetical protein
MVFALKLPLFFFIIAAMGSPAFFGCLYLGVEALEGLFFPLKSILASICWFGPVAPRIHTFQGPLPAKKKYAVRCEDRNILRKDFIGMSRTPPPSFSLVDLVIAEPV